MADWLNDLIAAARAGGPVACAICGTPTPVEDLLETYLPARIVKGDQHFPVSFVLSELAWVCPRCSAFAKPEGGDA